MTKRISPTYRLFPVQNQKKFTASKKINRFLIPRTTVRAKLHWINDVGRVAAFKWHDVHTNNHCTFDWDDVVVAGSGGYLFEQDDGVVVMGFKLPENTKIVYDDDGYEYECTEIYVAIASIFGFHEKFPQQKSMLVWLRDAK